MWQLKSSPRGVHHQLFRCFSLHYVLLDFSCKDRVWRQMSPEMREAVFGMIPMKSLSWGTVTPLIAALDPQPVLVMVLTLMIHKWRMLLSGQGRGRGKRFLVSFRRINTGIDCWISHAYVPVLVEGLIARTSSPSWSRTCSQ